MNILYASSEVVPFAKTGGLADVLGALPREMAALGHQVSVFLPAFRQALSCGQPIETTGQHFTVLIGNKLVEGQLLASRLPGSEVPVYLVAQDDYFNRDQLYGVDGVDYVDNCERFTFFCRGVLEAIRLLDLKVDVLHANDWPTGLLPAYLKTEYAGVPPYEEIATLFTIHNLAYQGQFWHWDMLLTGLDWKLFNWRQMEFFGKLNLMKTGLVFSDALSTVSQRYAEEIQSPPLGCGLEGVLQHRREILTGILNGVDYSAWDPATDPHLPRNYQVDNQVEGKAACQQALAVQLGLPYQPEVPLVGFVGRLIDQKGLDLILNVLTDWLRTAPVQWVFLGTGDPRYQAQLAALAERYPQKLAVRLKFSEPLAHQIEAASDIFLMPSQYEPCGLNQLYSLKYGAVPLVRATGGLADTITNTTPETLAAGTANGFSFQEYSVLGLAETLRRACDTYADRPTWRRIVETGMRQDWSWARSARAYSDLYAQTLSRVRTPVLLPGP